MFNQLYELSSSMEKAGITTTSWHKNLKTCPKSKTVIVYIDSTCNISDLKLVDNPSQFKKYEEALGESFPAFNLTAFYHIQNQTNSEKDKIDRIKKLIKDNNSPDTLKNELICLSSEREIKTLCKVENLKKCINKSENLNEIIGGVDEKYQSFNELISRFRLLKGDSEQVCSDRIKAFIIQLKDVTIDKISSASKEDGMLLFSSIFCCTAKTLSNFSIILELSDHDQYEYPFNHNQVYSAINKALLNKDSIESEANQENTRKDVYGCAISGSDTTFPAVKINKLGDVIIWAMNSESPCFKRYSKKDSELFTVGNTRRQTCKDALEWLSKSENENFTWKDISGTCGNSKGKPIPTILFAYPTEIPETTLEIANMFAGTTSCNDEDGVRFSNISSKVIKSLDALKKDKPNVNVNILAISRVSKGQTKMLVSQCFKVNQIISGAEDWISGCSNISELNINIKNENNLFFIPFPSELTKCLNASWCRNGQWVEQVDEIRMGDAIILLATSPEKIKNLIDDMLYKCIKNTKSLLLEIGHVTNRRDGPFNWKNTKAFKNHINFIPSIIGLLLYKLGYQKGQYMSSPAFLIGQLMSLADVLHREYCVKVRKGSLPTQLIGNAAMNVALNNPEEGLARLSERILIYQAWAKTVHENGYAGWALSEFGNISSMLGDCEIPKKATDVEKAQLLLGYLSRISKKDGNVLTVTTNENTETNITESEAQNG